MKIFFPFAIIALAAVVFLPPGQAAGHGIGIDLIRLVDENQDDGMLNIHGQVKVADDIALFGRFFVVKLGKKNYQLFEVS